MSIWGSWMGGELTGALDGAEWNETIPTRGAPVTFDVAQARNWTELLRFSVRTNDDQTLDVEVFISPEEAQALARALNDMADHVISDREPSNS